MFLMSTSCSRGYMKSGISLGRYNIINITIWLWIGLALATLVTSQQNFYTNGRYGKRQDPRAVSSFWSGSRYGRSGNTMSEINEDDKKLESVEGGGGGGGGSKDVELSPRMDRFFLGSRYGKRAHSNDADQRPIDSLKNFKTSLDFLMSIGHRQTHATDNKKEELIKNNNKNSLNMKSDVDYGDNNINNINGSAASSIGLIKSYESLAALSDNEEYACLYTGVTNLYRCFNRKSYEESEESSK